MGSGRTRCGSVCSSGASTGGEVREVIHATNSSLEGESTATYLQPLLSQHAGVRVTRLARGLPVGGELEYVDGVTLTHALTAREELR